MSRHYRKYKKRSFDDDSKTLHSRISQNKDSIGSIMVGLKGGKVSKSQIYQTADGMRVVNKEYKNRDAYKCRSGV